MQQHGSKYFARRALPSPTPLTIGSKGQNSTFSEHGHVVYQIKDNHKCSNMLANILPTDPDSLALGMGSVDQNSSSEHSHVAYQIKDNHKCSNMLANILPADPYSLALGMGSVDQNSSSEHGHVAYQIKDNHKCSNMLANILPTDPHSLALGMGSVDQNLTFSEHGHVVYLFFYFFF